MNAVCTSEKRFRPSEEIYWLLFVNADADLFFISLFIYKMSWFIFYVLLLYPYFYNLIVWLFWLDP